MEKCKTDIDTVYKEMVRKVWEVKNNGFSKELEETDLIKLDCCKGLYAYGRYHIRDHHDLGDFYDRINCRLITDDGIDDYVYLKDSIGEKKYIEIFEKEYLRVTRMLHSLGAISYSLCASNKSL